MFKLFKTKDEANLKLASELLKAFNLDCLPTTKKALKIINNATTKKEIADKIISLCIDIDASKAYHYIASAYEFKGTKFRLKVIEFLNKFLQNPIFDDIDRHYRAQRFYKITTKEIELSNVYENLGNAYEGEYDFNNALTCYLRSYEINPCDTRIYCRLARIYSKMNDLDKSISLLKEAKFSNYYIVLKWTNILGENCTDSTFSTVIDSQLNYYEGKKKRGYIYKPIKYKKKLLSKTNKICAPLC
jgi:tetratricopeptide (TPR) repeat protein